MSASVLELLGIDIDDLNEEQLKSALTLQSLVSAKGRTKAKNINTNTVEVNPNFTFYATPYGMMPLFGTPQQPFGQQGAGSYGAYNPFADTTHVDTSEWEDALRDDAGADVDAADEDVDTDNADNTDDSSSTARIPDNPLPDNHWARDPEFVFGRIARYNASVGTGCAYDGDHVIMINTSTKGLVAAVNLAKQRVVRLDARLLEPSDLVYRLSGAGMIVRDFNDDARVELYLPANTPIAGQQMSFADLDDLDNLDDDNADTAASSTADNTADITADDDYQREARKHADTAQPKAAKAVKDTKATKPKKTAKGAKAQKSKKAKTTAATDDDKSDSNTADTADTAKIGAYVSSRDARYGRDELNDFEPEIARNSATNSDTDTADNDNDATATKAKSLTGYEERILRRRIARLERKGEEF